MTRVREMPESGAESRLPRTSAPLLLRGVPSGGRYATEGGADGGGTVRTGVRGVRGGVRLSEAAESVLFGEVQERETAGRLTTCDHLEAVAVVPPAADDAPGVAVSPGGVSLAGRETALASRW
jgi:hypothetical protein